MRWRMSPWVVFMWNVVVAAVIAAIYLGNGASLAVAAGVFAAIAATGTLEAALVRPRQRRATREPLLSVWDVTSSPYVFVAGLLGWKVLFGSTWLGCLVFAVALTMIEIVEDAGSRRRNARSSSDVASGEPAQATP